MENTVTIPLIGELTFIFLGEDDKQIKKKGNRKNQVGTNATTMEETRV